jgi:hypothetical protein
MLGTPTTAFGFSGAANALASPINPRWATGGTVRRGASRSCALGSYGARTVLCRSNREVMYERTYQRILEMLAYHETVRKQGASYPTKIQTGSASCPSVAAMPK